MLLYGSAAYWGGGTPFMSRGSIRKNWPGILALWLIATTVQAQTDVLVSRYDSGRTGQNLSETSLSVQNVGSGSFGKLYSYPLDGVTYAQPLVKASLTIPGKGTYNVVFLATEHGSVYALDADSATPIWHRSFINPAAGLTTRATSSTLEDIIPEVSITSTPVIDPVGGTLYVVAETVQTGQSAYYWLHALDITTGLDKTAPVAISGSVGSGATPLNINAATSTQRPGLVFLNGVVYLGFGSNGDNWPWVGWLAGYDGTTLQQLTLYCTSPGGSQGAGLWSSGEAPPVDASGNIYVTTGNGYFGASAWGDSYLKLSTSGGLSLLDYFSPFNSEALYAADLDLAAGGPILLPDSVGSAAHPHLLVGAGKDGEIYLIDRDNMGGYNGSYSTPNSQIVQWVWGQVGTGNFTPTSNPLPYVGNNFSSPAYWQNRLYFCGSKDVCKLFTFSNGLLSGTPASKAPTSFGYPGGQPIISAASASAASAILWAVERNTTLNSAVLHAYDATNLASELYNATQAANSRDLTGPPAKFAVPTVANGKVFVATQTEVNVYGLLAGAPQALAAPTFAPAPGSYTGTQSVTLSAAAGASIYYTLDGTSPTLGATRYTGPIAMSSSGTINAMAVQSGAFTSPAASGTYTISPVVNPPSISYVQGAYATPQSAQTSVAVKYAAAQQQGDLNVVVVGWNDSTATVKSVTDTSGNSYTLAVGPTVYSGVASQAIYYAPNIAAAAAGGNSVTVTFNTAAAYADIRIAEYSGIASSSPFDGGAGTHNAAATATSGAITTTNANDLLVGADLTIEFTLGPGSGFTSRMMTVPDGDILEDRVVTSAGSYAATAGIAASAPTIMQIAAFKAGTGAAPPTPTAPSGLNATATGPTGVSLAWTAATESGGSIAQYLIERCQGSGCSSFAQIGTATTTAYADAGLSGSTSYSYRVRAKDAAGNVGPYSNSATVTTSPGVPSAPTNLAATVAGSAQINLSWGASSEAGGTIAQYLIERCQGSGCSSFTQIGTATATSYSDTGLSGSTSYSYRVRAKDAQGNTGAYSNVATASTGAPGITAPASLTAAAQSATQIALSWSAATETGGTITQYLIERCQGSGCSSFTQVATSSALTYTDGGLSAGSSYSYRVRASDASGNTGPYSNVATASTSAALPSAPGTLSASASGATQVNLSWGAASESGGTISQYLIERCQGSGCSSFAQIATATALTYADGGLAGGTSYSYRVRAKDAQGNTGAYSNVATVTTAAPSITAPANLSAATQSSTQINLTWSAATESGGTISQYLIERCQGSGCSTFTQVATSTALAYNDATLTAGTTYSYRVRAGDAGGNTGPYSNVATATTSAASQPPAIAFVQLNYATPQTPQSKVTVTYKSLQTAGDLNVVVVGWNDSIATVGSLTDSSGNTYRLAVGPTVISGTASQAIYYAANIVGAAAGANTVSVNFSSAAVYADVRVLEYSGLDPNNPLDVVATGTGNSGTTASPAVTTTYANDLLIGANLVLQTTTGPGSGWTSRVITQPDSDIVEDRIVSATGSYSATAPLAPPAPWIMQLVSFRRHP